MPSKWYDYWSRQVLQQINLGISQWRQSGHTRVQLQGLRNLTSRKDLYSCVTVTVHGPSGNIGGKQHMLDLSRVLSPMLRSMETVKICIVQDTGNDYLEFS